MRIVALLLLSGILAVAIACGSGGDNLPATSTPATPTTTGTATSSSDRSELSLRGENVERIANTSVQRVTWADGTVYEEIIPTLILRTIGRPDAPQGRRVVASWLEDERWLVTFFVRVEDQTTEPATVIDLRAEFYYDEGSGVFEPANGRGYFAFNGTDPCASDKPPAELCPLDKEIVP
jgi:hypothetical protein